MSVHDPVADLLTCIRNAQMMRIQDIRVPHSNLKIQILNVLKEEGYLENFETVADDNKKNISIRLKHFDGKPVIEKIKRVSRPALRVYKGYNKLPLVRGGLGIVIV